MRSTVVAEYRVRALPRVEEEVSALGVVWVRKGVISSM